MNTRPMQRNDNVAEMHETNNKYLRYIYILYILPYSTKYRLGSKHDLPIFLALCDKKRSTLVGGQIDNEGEGAPRSGYF